MSTKYTELCFIVVESANQIAANVQASNWGDDVGGGDTFGGSGLSPDGNYPTTHYICHTAATVEMYAQIESAKISVPFVGVYRDDEGWTEEMILNLLGLTRIGN